MATKAYQTWHSLGRPLQPAQPIREIVERMREAFPDAAAAHLFSWYADDAHYQASNPLDHTPYSTTAWPNPLPGYWVCATDIMHRPDLGVDCFTLFDYWIGEARAGRMPWLKYLIWQGKSYSVKSGWKAQSASGHYDHIHISTRTDHLQTSLGAWVLVPGTEGSAVMLRPCKRGNKGTGASLQLQQVLEWYGTYTASLDDDYGPKTAKALADALADTPGEPVTGDSFGPVEAARLQLAIDRKYGTKPAPPAPVDPDVLAAAVNEAVAAAIGRVKAETTLSLSE